MIRRYKINDTVFAILSSVTLLLALVLTVLVSISLNRITYTKNKLLSHTCQPTVVYTSDDSYNTSADTQQKARMYVLGIKDGMLTVYAADGATVIEIFDTAVYSLPQKDREALALGIEIFSVNELTSLIQDYTS